MLYKAGATIDYWDTINLQLELGTTATDYAPFQGNTYDITFPSEAGTVYGGTLDVVTGKLVVDSAIVNFGELQWLYGNNNGRWAHSLFYANIVDRENASNYICTGYPFSTLSVGDAAFPNIACGKSSNSYVYVRNDQYTDATAFAESVSGMQIYYSLAIPITYQLSTTEVETFLGTNNIWANTGDILSVEYSADTKEYVDGKPIPVQDVQVNGASILQNGVANMPIASVDVFGVTKIARGKGLYKASDDGIGIYPATNDQVKVGTDNSFALTPAKTQDIAFYGLAKAAGSNEKNSTLPVGQYTEAAKSAIKSMLGVGEWQLIKMVTLSEDSSSIKITTDENSESFKLKEFAFVVLAQPSESTTSNTSAYARIDPYNYVANMTGVVRTSPTTFSGYIKPIATAAENHQACMAQICCYGANASIYYNGDAFVYPIRNYCDYFEVYTTGTAKFGAGTVVTLLGVRA